MADIISLDARVQQAGARREERLARHKIRTVASIFHSARNLTRCDKCGVSSRPQAAGANNGTIQVRAPYRFCRTCAREYDDFIQRLQGGGDPDHYWQNDVWLESWKHWIDYQSSMASFRRSKAFRRLVQEIKNKRPHE